MEREEKKERKPPKGTALMALVSLLLLTTFARPVIIAAFLVAQIQSSGCVSVDIKGRNAKSSFLFSSLGDNKQSSSTSRPDDWPNCRQIHT